MLAEIEKGQSPPFNPADEETKDGDIDPSFTATAYSPVAQVRNEKSKKLIEEIEKARNRRKNGQRLKNPEISPSDVLVNNFFIILKADILNTAIKLIAFM